MRVFVFAFFGFLVGTVSCANRGVWRGGGSHLTLRQLQQLVEVEECSGRRNLRELPIIRYVSAMRCPRVGGMCCIAGLTIPPGFDGCPAGSDGGCGILGYYEPAFKIIYLPHPNQLDDNCPDAFKHEALHYLGFWHGDPILKRCDDI